MEDSLTRYMAIAGIIMFGLFVLITVLYGLWYLMFIRPAKRENKKLFKEK